MAENTEEGYLDRDLAGGSLEDTWLPRQLPQVPAGSSDDSVGWEESGFRLWRKKNARRMTVSAPTFKTRANDDDVNEFLEKLE